MELEAALACRGRQLLPAGGTLLMGILNVTPDSFSDGGRFLECGSAVDRALKMAGDGADIVDVGGESTRPGCSGVPEAEELARVVPVIEGVAKQSDVVISVDTSKASVARAALEGGAHIVNDVTALRGDPEMAGVAASAGAGVVLMHMLGEPRTMQERPEYGDVVAEIVEFLRGALERAAAAGVAADATVVDPGIGFGKLTGHNLEIVRSIREFHVLGRPVLLGPSRKSFIGNVLDLPVGERMEGTAAAVAAGVMGGVQIVRVHDVKEMKRVARMAEAIRAGMEYEECA